jgi:hypothetical protein
MPNTKAAYEWLALPLRNQEVPLSIVTEMSVVFLIPFREKHRRRVHPTSGHEGPDGEYRHSSNLPLTSALDGVVGQRHASAALTLGKTRYSLYRRLGGPQGRSGRVRKISHPPGFDPRAVQPVASRYTDWAIQAHQQVGSLLFLSTSFLIHYSPVFPAFDTVPRLSFDNVVKQATYK